MTTLNLLRKGQKALICDFEIEHIPLKLLEMGCLPGNTVELIQRAPFGDPLFLCVNGSNLAIRIETAKQISIEIMPDNE